MIDFKFRKNGQKRAKPLGMLASRNVGALKGPRISILDPPKIYKLVSGHLAQGLAPPYCRV